MKFWKIMALSLSVLGTTLPAAAVLEKDLQDAQRTAIRRGMERQTAGLAIGPLSGDFLRRMVVGEAEGGGEDPFTSAYYLNSSAPGNTGSDFSDMYPTPRPEDLQAPFPPSIPMKWGDTTFSDTEELNQSGFFFRHVYLDFSEIGTKASATFRALAQIMPEDGCLYLLGIDDFDPLAAPSSVKIDFDQLLEGTDRDNLFQVWQVLQRLKAPSDHPRPFTYEEALPTFSRFLNESLKTFFHDIETNGSSILTLSGFLPQEVRAAPPPPLTLKVEEDEAPTVGSSMAASSSGAAGFASPGPHASSSSVPYPPYPSYSGQSAHVGTSTASYSIYRGNLRHDDDGNVRVTYDHEALPINTLRAGYYFRRGDASFLITSVDPATSSFTIALPAIVPPALRDWSQPLNFSVSPYSGPNSPFSTVDFTNDTFFHGLIRPGVREMPDGATFGLLTTARYYMDPQEFYLFKDGQWILHPVIGGFSYFSIPGTRIFWLGGDPVRPEDLRGALRVEARKTGEYRNIRMEADGHTSVKIFLQEPLTAPINPGDWIQLNTRDPLSQELDRAAGMRRIAAIEPTASSGPILHLTGPLEVERVDPQHLAGIEITAGMEIPSVVDLTKDEWLEGHQDAGQAEDGTRLTKSLFFSTPRTQVLLIPGTSILSTLEEERATRKIVRVEEHGPYMHVIYSGPRLYSLEDPDMVIAHQFGLTARVEEEGYPEILVQPNPLGAPQEGRMVIAGTDGIPLGIIVALDGDAETGWSLFLEQSSTSREELSRLAEGPLRLVPSQLSTAAVNYSRAGWHKGWQPLADADTKSKRFFIPFSKANEDAFKPGAILLFSVDNVVSIEAVDTNAEKTFIYVYTKQPVDLREIDQNPRFELLPPGGEHALLTSLTPQEGYATVQAPADRDWKQFIGHSFSFPRSDISLPIVDATESPEGWSLTLGCHGSYADALPRGEAAHLMLAHLGVNLYSSQSALDFSSEGGKYKRGWDCSQENGTSTRFLLPKTDANLRSFAPGQSVSLDGVTFSKILEVGIDGGLMHVYLKTPVDISNVDEDNTFKEDLY